MARVPWRQATTPSPRSSPRAVVRLPLVGDLRVVAVLVHGVGDGLTAAVGKVDEVRSAGGGACSLLAVAEVRAVVGIRHLVLEGVMALRDGVV